MPESDSMPDFNASGMPVRLSDVDALFWRWAAGPNADWIASRWATRCGLACSASAASPCGPAAWTAAAVREGSASSLCLQCVARDAAQPGGHTGSLVLGLRLSS